ncbi:putative P-type phospholipid transporter [Helianthus anomalus]
MLFLIQKHRFRDYLYFEAFIGFSDQSVYDNCHMLLFSVVLTSLPVTALGDSKQDVSSEIYLQVRFCSK